MKVLITTKLAQKGIDIIKSAGFEAVTILDLDEAGLAKVIGDYDALVIRSESKVTANVLANPGKLKAVARAGVGVDNVDVAAAKKKGVVVMNTPGGNTISAAEHTLALMLALSRHVVPACNSLKAGKWDRKQFMGSQLNNKVLGIIGLGRIGLAVAKMSMGFNMKVLGFDPLVTPPNAKELGIEVADSVEQIYKEADYITVHVPKNDKTLNMISAPQIAMMKPSVRLINTARGGIINEDALYDALEQKRIAGAALDVYPEEPPKDTRFVKYDNCLATPHLAASTHEAQIEVAVEAAQLVVDFLQGKPARNVVKA